MTKACIFLGEGFEEIEATTTIDVLKRASVKVDIISISDKLEVVGAHNIKYIVDKVITDILKTEYDIYILPGGMPGTLNLMKSNELADILKEAHANKKIIAAICAAPMVLGKLGIIKGQSFTCYPGCEEKIEGNYTKKAVNTEKNIITGKGPAFAFDFALEILKNIQNEQKIEMLKNALLL